MKYRFLAALAACSIMGATVANAADVYTPPVYADESIGSAIDIAFGVTFTTSYVSRGYDYSRGPAVQGYVEASYDWAYVGIWGSTVRGPLVDPDRFEYDIYGGIRPTFGDLALDFGYVHYFYNRSGECCGELYAKASYTIQDFTPGVELYYDPRNETSYGALTASYALPNDFSISGGVGTNFRRNVDWNAGVSYTYAEAVTFDLRYYGSNRHDPDMFRSKFVASISFDTSLSAIRNWGR